MSEKCRSNPSIERMVHKRQVGRLCKSWLKKKLQKLNEDKTKIIVIGSDTFTSRMKTLHNIQSVLINGHRVELCDSVRNLGVIVDENLSFKKQIMRVVKSCNQQLKNIAFIRKYLKIHTLKILASQQILSRIDYCNSIYYNLPTYLLKKLQTLMNKTARMIFRKPFGEHVSPLYIQLHWLPIKARILYKLCCLVHNAIHQGLPVYLKSKLQRVQYENTITRNCTMAYKLDQPFANNGFGARSFTYSAPRIFNSLPEDLRKIEDYLIFKKKLKTFFFSEAYDLVNNSTREAYKI